MGKQEQSEEYDQDVRDIIDSLKSKGLFDQFRKEFVADVDTKVCLILFFHYFILGKPHSRCHLLIVRYYVFQPSYQNLKQRVEGYVNRFLSRQTWSPDLNKNQLRDNLRRQINQYVTCIRVPLGMVKLTEREIRNFCINMHRDINGALQL